MRFALLLICVTAVAIDQAMAGTNIVDQRLSTMFRQMKSWIQQHNIIGKQLNITSKYLESLIRRRRPQSKPSSNETCSTIRGSPTCYAKRLGTFTGVTELECAAEAARKNAVFYRYRGSVCEVKGQCKNAQPNPCRCQWSSLKSKKEYLLLRVFAHSGVRPYSYMVGSASSPCINVKPGTTNPFRSPLFLVQNEVKFTKARIVFLTAGKRVAEVRFHVRNTKRSLLDGEWYQRRNIYQMYPWAMRELYGYQWINPNFRMKGFTDNYVFRPFYISGKHHGCPRDTGFLAVVERDVRCRWGMSSKGYPLFVYNSKPRRPWNMRERADEMRIYGLADSVDENLFTRSENCLSC